MFLHHLHNIYANAQVPIYSPYKSAKFTRVNIIVATHLGFISCIIQNAMNPAGYKRGRQKLPVDRVCPLSVTPLSEYTSNYFKQRAYLCNATGPILKLDISTKETSLQFNRLELIISRLCDTSHPKFC